MHASLSLALLLTLAAVDEERFALSVGIEPSPVRFGERFHLVVEVERAEGDRLALPQEIPEIAAAPRAGPPERALTPLAGEPGRVVEVIRLPFLALDLDDVETPRLILTAPDGSELVVEKQPVPVESDGAAAPPPEDVAAALEEGERVLGYRVLDTRPLVGAGAVALALAGWLALRALDRRRRARYLTRPAPPSPRAQERPAHEIALMRLDALLAEGLLPRGEVTPFVARLMDEVLRDYLERRYRVQAGSRTTGELVDDLLQVSAPGLDVDALRSLLDDADLVKFARAELAADVAHRMAGKVRELVEQTAERAP